MEADASTNRNFGGTGLGLVLMRRYCQMMGGEVTVSSVLGEGSVFTIKRLAGVWEARPGTAAEAADTVVASPYKGDGGATESLPSQLSCVLVIHDDPTQRDLIQRFLSKEGFRVRTVEDRNWF